VRRITCACGILLLDDEVDRGGEDFEVVRAVRTTGEPDLRLQTQTTLQPTTADITLRAFQQHNTTHHTTNNTLGDTFRPFLPVGRYHKPLQAPAASLSLSRLFVPSLVPVYPTAATALALTSNTTHGSSFSILPFLRDTRARAHTHTHTHTHPPTIHRLIHHSHSKKLPRDESSWLVANKACSSRLFPSLPSIKRPGPSA
jgi:hypothetical protein